MAGRRTVSASAAATGGLVTALALAALTLAGCGADTDAPGPSDLAAEAGWTGTIETEGPVTTVRNESGTVWGSDVRLVREVSIGQEDGPDEYLFGSASVWATDERIVVGDSQVPAVRVYDLDGRHLFDVGREGEGPGEFTEVAAVAVDGQARILVLDANQAVEVFGPDGEPVDTWAPGSVYQIGTPQMLVLDDAGVPWVPYIRRLDDGFDLGKIRVGPEGYVGEAVFPPDLEYESACLQYDTSGREGCYYGIPYAPGPWAVLAPDGSWIVGVNDEYRFEVRGPDDGGLVVEASWDPVPVSPEEAAFLKQRTTETVRERITRDPEWTWSGPEIPGHKPAYREIWPGRDGRVWVFREGPSRRSTDCEDGAPECWRRDDVAWDVFGADGRLLGSVAGAPRSQGPPYLDGDTAVVVVMDELGTIEVERYRLVHPGGG